MKRGSLNAPLLSSPGGGGDEGGPKKEGLGLFAGVFTTCICSIFGVILFQRLTWVVGQAGLLYTFCLFAVGYAVVVCTTLSISAIVTNGRVSGGGAYFLISRSLGPEFGGGVGVVFYLANVAAGGVYLIGFAEGLVDAFGIAGDRWHLWAYASVALVVFGFVCVVGAELYTKSSMLILAGLVVSIGTAFASFVFQKEGVVKDYSGPESHTLSINLSPHFADGFTVTTVFPVLFPAVTGVMAGCNMSGDLADPARSIPKGTLLALAVSAAVYVPLSTVIAWSVHYEGLNNEEKGYSAMHDISFVPAIISCGVLLATASSAMGSLIGAGRVLQALARDRLLPGLGVFAQGSGAADEPRIGVVFTMVLVLLEITASSDLNTLASFATLFFLISYAVVNCACFILSVQGSPNFRPTWRYFTWHTALLGVILSVVIMFVVNPVQGLVSLLFAASVVGFIHMRAPQVEWGDVSQSLIFHQVRRALLRLDERREHVKFWRPHVLLLVSSPRTSYRLIELGNCLKKAGLLLAAQVIEGDPAGATVADDVAARRHAWLEYISHRRLKAFPSVTVAPTVRAGAQQLMISAGLGAMRPNTVLMGLHVPGLEPQQSINTLNLDDAREDALLNALHLFPPARAGPAPEARGPEWVDTVRDALRLRKNVVVAANLARLDHRLVDGLKDEREAALEESAWAAFDEDEDDQPPGEDGYADDDDDDLAYWEEDSDAASDAPSSASASASATSLSSSGGGGGASRRRKKHRRRTIDVWALPLERFGSPYPECLSSRADADESELSVGFALLLGHILKRSRGEHRFAKQTTLRLLTAVATEAEVPAARQRLRGLLQSSRIRGAVRVVCVESALRAPHSWASSGSLVSPPAVPDARLVPMAAVPGPGGAGSTPLPNPGPDASVYQTLAFAMASVQRRTAITLCPAPRPVQDSDPHEYLAALRELTATGAPTLLCNGVQRVLTNVI